MPTSDHVGHLGGDSPWSGDAPTKDRVFDRYATDVDLDLTLRRDTVRTNNSVQIPIAITNGGETTEDVVVRLRIREHVLDEWSGPIPQNDERRVTLSDGGRSNAGEMAVTMNGQKYGRVAVLDAD